MLFDRYVDLMREQARSEARQRKPERISTPTTTLVGVSFLASREKPLLLVAC
jgi:hypothetical protein